MVESKTARRFYKAAEKGMTNLYARWLDEQGYEHIENYKTPWLRKLANDHGVEIVKMTAEPFGFQFACDNRVYQLFLQSNSYGYRRIA